MLILHTSDWHLGRSLHGADLGGATAAFLDWLGGLVEERGVDAVLVSGDVFDRAVPPVGSLNQMSQALARLCAVTRVVLVPGNHDSATRLGFTSELLRASLTILSDPLDIGRGVEVHGADGEVALVYPIPYLEPDLVRDALAEGADAPDPTPLPRSHEAVMAAALRRVRTDLVRRRGRGEESAAIAMVHTFVTGATPSDSERDIQVGGVPSVPALLFDTLGADPGVEPLGHGLDYVAAGHLHRPQDVAGARVPIRYSGSPIAYSFSEAGAAKSVTLLDIGGGALRDTEVVPVPTARRLSVVAGPMEQLLSPAFDEVAEDYLSVTVTDDARPPEMVARLRARFTHALVVLHQPGHLPDTAVAVAGAVGRSPREVARDFFTEVGGRPLDEEETKVLDDVWTEVSREVGA
ncbi:exonuclease SbcCD subunit D [Actinomyces provencensis]|uniref:exonuclease SbcCD subunit D n=1 Tax=Actinomyces provencensis TaxID=1720198 RepID=UPI00096A5507|nr:exonuclease SbcCD subunit D C-terminal domain-containing protein [Actinomyces provencensis]